MSMYSMVTAINRASESSLQRRRLPKPLIQPPTKPELSKFHERVIAEIRDKLASHEHHLSKKKCPRCSRRFIEVVVDQVNLEYCRGCRGWWFDDSELKHFTELFEDIADGDLIDRVSSLPCAICEAAMHRQPLTVHSNMIVHVCPFHHGIFLNDGDFERALIDSERVDGLAGHLNDEHLAVWRQLQSRLADGSFHPSRIKCLECRGQAVAINLDNIEMDYCTQCQSCWFDSKELCHFTHQPRDVPGDHLTSRQSDCYCPKCDRAMRLYQFHPHSNVLVEACPCGHGVYLRGGQFPRVLKACE